MPRQAAKHPDTRQAPRRCNTRPGPYQDARDAQPSFSAYHHLQEHQALCPEIGAPLYWVSPASSTARGRVRIKVVPSPSTLSNDTCPPCAARISWTMYKPKPVPPGLRRIQGLENFGTLLVADAAAGISDLELHVRGRTPAREGEGSPRGA